MMIKKNAAAKIFFVLALVLLAACADATSTPSRKPLKVEWTTWQGDYSLLVADEMGFFDQHGIDVELVYYASTTAAIPDLAGAKLDGGLFTRATLSWLRA